MATKYENKYVGEVLVKYKKILESELKRELKKPGSKLEGSIVVKKLRGLDGIGVSMNEYGLNVNQGRSAGRFSRGGTQLPKSFMDWVENQPRKKAKDGKMYTIRESAFLIWRKISETGIKPNRFIDIVIDKIEPRMTLDIQDAYFRDLNLELDKTTKNAGSKN